MSEEQPSTDGRGGTRAKNEASDDLPPVPSEEEMPAAELDTLFETLANRERRLVLTYLVDADDGIATFSDLIDHVVGDTASDDDRERMAIQLHHVHLPKLGDYGLVEYDTRSETVRYRGSRTVTEWVNSMRQ